MYGEGYGHPGWFRLGLGPLCPSVWGLRHVSVCWSWCHHMWAVSDQPGSSVLVLGALGFLAPSDWLQRRQQTRRFVIVSVPPCATGFMWSTSALFRCKDRL